MSTVALEIVPDGTGRYEVKAVPVIMDEMEAAFMSVHPDRLLYKEWCTMVDSTKIDEAKQEEALIAILSSDNPHKTLFMYRRRFESRSECVNLKAPEETQQPQQSPPPPMPVPQSQQQKPPPPTSVTNPQPA